MQQPDNVSQPQEDDRLCNMEIVIGVLVALVAIAAIVVSNRFPGTGLATDVGSARFPQIYSGALIVLCGILIVQNLPRPNHASRTGNNASETGLAKPAYRKTFVGIVATALCLMALPFLGYPLATAIYLSFLMWLMGMRHKAGNPLLALTITGILYFTFSAGLHVPLPIGSFFE